MAANGSSGGKRAGAAGRDARRALDGERFDAVVVGSGIGGLAAAVLLGQEAGWRVAVLERHDAAGGFTHTFSRHGWEWDVGVHYIGGVTRRGSLVRRLFDRISEGRLEWEPLGEVVDRVVIGGREFELAAGREAWRERLAAAFPGRETALDRYLAAVAAAAGASRAYFGSKALPGTMDILAGWALRRKFLRWSDRTVAEVLDGITDDPELRAVLTARYGDYGLTPARASWGIHALVEAHYLGGAGYPVGGSAAIAASIVPTIEGLGGVVATKAPVRRILVERGRAAGVELEDGVVVRAPVVVSDAGAAITARRLMPGDAPGRRALLAAVERVGPSAGHVCLHVGLDAPDAELGLGRANLWLYPGTDHDAAMARYRKDRSAPLPAAFVSFPSAKDPSFQERHPGKATVEVVGWAPWEWFERWRDTEWKRRGEAYGALKAELEARYLETLLEHVPGIRGHVAFTDLSTPLTTRWFCAHEQGEIYGLDHTPQRFRERALRPRTGLPGLYLTGADACTAGVAGALFGGVLAASAILGRRVSA